jgi:hypothetical protein
MSIRIFNYRFRVLGPWRGESWIQQESGKKKKTTRSFGGESLEMEPRTGNPDAVIVKKSRCFLTLGDLLSLVLWFLLSFLPREDGPKRKEERIKGNKVGLREGKRGRSDGDKRGGKSHTQIGIDQKSNPGCCCCLFRVLQTQSLTFAGKEQKTKKGETGKKWGIYREDGDPDILLAKSRYTCARKLIKRREKVIRMKVRR